MKVRALNCFIPLALVLLLASCLPPTTTPTPTASVVFREPMQKVTDVSSPYVSFTDVSIGTIAWLRLDDPSIKPDRAIAIYEQRYGSWIRKNVDSSVVIRDGYILISDFSTCSSATAIRAIASWDADSSVSITAGQATVILPARREKVVEIASPYTPYNDPALGTADWIKIDDAEIKPDRPVSPYIFYANDWTTCETDLGVVARDGSLLLGPYSALSSTPKIRAIVSWTEAESLVLPTGAGTISQAAPGSKTADLQAPFTSYSDPSLGTIAWIKIDDPDIQPGRRIDVYMKYSGEWVGAYDSYKVIRDGSLFLGPFSDYSTITAVRFVSSWAAPAPIAIPPH